MQTLDKVMTAHEVEIPEHLEAQAEIPLVSGAPQRQGDVMVLPMRPGKVSGLGPVPPEGIPVIRGEAGGNTHLLVAEGPVSWAPQANGTAVMGTLDVAEDGAAYLIHPEHGATGIGPGQYLIRRQREQADEIRLVQD